MKRYSGIILAGMVMTGILALPGEVAASDQETKIHFISLASTTDAVLLESNGHYGLVDSGEDWEYPDGTDARYPLREGITSGIGYEQQVIHYLKSQGVEKLDFYIATHSHSDHIGSGDEILDTFPTDRLYINRYDDAYILEENGSHLWDNQYVYDDIIDAANRNGVQIITDLDQEENAQYRSFLLGEMTIDLMNLERRKDEGGNVLPVAGENENCIVTKVTARGKTALLTADLDPTEGDTKKIADKLIEELGELEENQNENQGIEIELEDSYPKENYAEKSSVDLDLPETRVVPDTDGEPIFDESKKNMEKTISLDLMKMNHHSLDYNNTTYFLTSLNPKDVVVTGYKSWFNARERDCLPKAEVYATATDSAAVVAEFMESGIETDYVKLSSEWMEIDGTWYYFDENGRTFTDQGAHEIDGVPYCFDYRGALETQERWAWVNGNWKWWLPTGEYYREAWLNQGEKNYYLDEQGNAVKGWRQIDGNWYYFDENCALMKDTWIGNDYVDESGIWIQEAGKGQWISSGSHWWFCHPDGSYTKSDWEVIAGKTYYFDEAGWMVIGWQWIDGKCYYFEPGGTMATDTWIGNDYVDESGVWVPGAMKDQWILSGNRWWYRHADGSCTKSDWERIDGNWYYFDEAGWIVTGWQQIGSEWYYFNDSGAMVTNSWVGNYYLSSTGVMATDTWIGVYYVDESGVWIPGKPRNQWVLSGNRWWYCHEDGSYTKSDWEKIDGKKYYFDEAGWMVTGWQLIEKHWYYFYDQGEMAANTWVGNYYMKSDGKMAVSEWVQDGRFYVDENGLWVQK